MNDECSICLDKLDKNIFILKCNHKFHKECLSRWLNVNPSCPLCRSIIKTEFNFRKFNFIPLMGKIKIYDDVVSINFKNKKNKIFFYMIKSLYFSKNKEIFIKFRSKKNKIKNKKINIYPISDRIIFLKLLKNRILNMI